METGSTQGRTTTADARAHAGAHTGNDTLAFLGAFGAGAALMYLLDPGRGARRRRMVTDQVVHAGRKAGDALGATARDLGNRAKGVAAGGRTRFSRDEADDRVIEERVRTELGRAASHPGAIQVAAEQRRVTLGGPVLAGEADRVLSAVRAVRGVEQVEDRLERHTTAGDVPGLQGSGRRHEPRPELLQENWAPATRLLTSAAGGALSVYGLRRSDAIGTVVGLAGLSLAVRGLTNLPASRLTGVAAGRRAVDVQKTINIARPVDEVFQFFTEWENWPSFMSHVREVRSSGRAGSVDGEERTHWVVDGPAGVPVAWDAVTTRLVPNELLSWKSVEGAMVQHAGTIRFLPTDQGGTRVDVMMSYNPPAGAVGHAVAAFLGRDPRRQMHDDLSRLKTTLETGTPPRDAARPAPGTVTPTGGMRSGAGSTEELRG